MRVLLVEDSPGDARLVTLALDDGFPAHERPVVEIATRLSEAIEKLTSSSYDVILLDMSLPDSHGRATVQATREFATDVPIVVLTGHDDEETARAAMADGAQDYLSKARIDGYVLARALTYAIERHRLVQELHRQSTRDELSGVLNRRGFRMGALAAVARSIATDRAVSVVYIDINGMKQINDMHGHRAGDAAVSDLGAILVATLRGGDVIGRVGGDEFCCVLSSHDRPPDVDTVLARLASALGRHNAEMTRDFPLLVSFGHVTVEPCDLTGPTDACLDQLMAAADEAMYRDKRHDG